MTQSDDRFAQWAAQFLNACAEGDTGASPAESPTPDGIQYAGLTRAANDLLRAIDADGIPAFVTANLKQIAKDNGIVVSAEWTPNEIIDALRAKAHDNAPGNLD